MQRFPTIIVRHQRENLKKCSLRGLESLEGFAFYSYPNPKLPDLTGSLILSVDAPVLSSADKDRPLIIVDATWRLADKIFHNIPQFVGLESRSLPPHFTTAYPRRQDDCTLPCQGLASIEAIYIAYHLMGHDTAGILDNYHWKEEFLEKNKDFF